MGFFSKIFGGNSADSAMNEALKGINKIIDDESYQLEILSPLIKDVIVKGAIYDKDPLGTGPFGLVDSNPIPVNGPLGEMSYLSRLETLSGDRLMFHRLGSIDKKDVVGSTTMVDVYEAVSFPGNQWFIFYVDFYHPRRSRALPDGFKFTEKVPQFTGFNKFCPNFPYDFAKTKSSEGESGLSFAYIPISRVMDGLENGIYQRPSAHEAKLKEVKSKLSFHLN
jgi:hypothetical protein